MKVVQELSTENASRRQQRKKAGDTNLQLPCIGTQLLSRNLAQKLQCLCHGGDREGVAGG